jgi:hypothetical protein
MAVIKKEITFTNIDGEEVTEEWWFGLEPSDVVDMEIAHLPNPAQYLMQIMEDHDSRALLELWRELMWRSAGKRIGKLFVKDEATLREFKYGGAYNAIFSEVCSSDDIGAAFFTSILPENIQQKIKEETNQEFTEQQLLEMSDEDFDRIAGTDTKKMSQQHFMIAYQRRSRKLGKTA